MQIIRNPNIRSQYWKPIIEAKRIYEKLQYLECGRVLRFPGEPKQNTKGSFWKESPMITDLFFEKLRTLFFEYIYDQTSSE